MSAYVSAARNGFRTALAYRWDFLSSSLYTPLFILVQVLLWTTAFRSGGVEQAGGLSLPEMRTYLLLAGLLWPLLGRIQVDRTVAGEVLDGALSLYLVRPLPHLRHRLAVFCGERLAWGLGYGIPLTAALGLLALPALLGGRPPGAGWFAAPPAGTGGWGPFALAFGWARAAPAC